MNLPISPHLLLPLHYYLNKVYPETTLQKLLDLFFLTVLNFKVLVYYVLQMVALKYRNGDSYSRYIGFEVDKTPNCKQSTRCKLQILSKKDVQKLLEACRKNSCTVQGAIQIAANVALLSILRDHGANLPVKMHTTVPFDSRKCALQDLSDGCAHFAGIQISYSEKKLMQNCDKISWTVGKKIKSTSSACYK